MIENNKSLEQNLKNANDDFQNQSKKYDILMKDLKKVKSDNLLLLAKYQQSEKHITKMKAKRDEYKLAWENTELSKLEAKKLSDNEIYDLKEQIK